MTDILAVQVCHSGQQFFEERLRRAEIKRFFQGFKSDALNVFHHGEATVQLGLLVKVVYFNDAWVVQAVQNFVLVDAGLFCVLVFENFYDQRTGIGFRIFFCALIDR